MAFGWLNTKKTGRNELLFAAENFTFSKASQQKKNLSIDTFHVVLRKKYTLSSEFYSELMLPLNHKKIWK